jgi:hypothetical protein
MRLRGFALRVLLAVLLVFTQQKLVLHELGHALDRLGHQTERQHPADQVCSLCLAFAGVHHAAQGGAALPDLPPQRFARPAGVRFTSSPSTFSAVYLSRAPPAQS